MEKSGEKANSEPENVADNLGEKTNSVWSENDDFVQGNFGDKLSESESVLTEANSGGDSISKKEQPSELEQIESFKFNPKRINSDLVGQTISDVFDEAKKGIVKAVYEFKTRFYGDVEWCNGNFEEYYSFSHVIRQQLKTGQNLNYQYYCPSLHTTSRQYYCPSLYTTFCQYYCPSLHTTMYKYYCRSLHTTLLILAICEVNVNC